jgi:hypothetical protein
MEIENMNMNQTKPGLARFGALLTGLCLAIGLMVTPANAAPKSSSLSIVPTVTNLTVVNGQLVASGTATATIKGRVYTAPFSNVPVTISLAQNQTNASAGCPVLDLALGPINLDLLGLVVQTSPICLVITAHAGGGLLGDLLCNIGTLLSNGVPLNTILGTLTPSQLLDLTGGLIGVLNGALQNLLNAVLTGISAGSGPGECAILHLALGPVDLTLLGLQVVLDNCSGGPVTVDLTAHHGGLLGNLLCSLAGNGGLPLGSLLNSILGGLLNLGPL